ncbi:uncharacterized protein LOC125379316 [Haliotis rufescens]|uniref:uncharacterized protein LOC125379316 n=1 Tax=Haliotis rufescens TaxID=6454 RepID=UPI00201F4ACC|nr:uncharacterized protein LOC125379316 [Haliotis rufescens]
MPVCAKTEPGRKNGHERGTSRYSACPGITRVGHECETHCSAIRHRSPISVTRKQGAGSKHQSQAILRMEKVFASITWSLNIVAGITTHTRARSVLSHLHRRSGLLGTSCICRWYSEMPKRNGCCRQAMPNEHFLSDKGRHRQLTYDKSCDHLDHLDHLGPERLPYISVTRC